MRITPFVVLLATFAIAPAAEAVQVFYSVGTSRSVPTDLTSGAPTVTITAGVATFTVAQPNNVGVGDEISYGAGPTLAYISGRLSATQYTVTDRLGAAPADVAGATVNRIYRAFATLSAAVTGSSDGTHLGTTVLTGAGNYQLNWPCYADGVMTLAPSAEVVIAGYTTGPANYIRVYTPVLGNEVGVSQRHRGVWGTGFQLQGTNADTIQIEDDYVRIEGLTIQATVTASGNWGGIWSIPSAVSDVRISHNIIKGVVTAGNNAYGVALGTVGQDLSKVWNNVIFNLTNSGGAFSICVTIDGGFAYVFNNTLYNCETGIRKWPSAAGAEVRNNAAIHDTVANPAYVDYRDLGVAPAAVRSNNVSSDATSETVALQNKTGFASYFRDTTPGTEDLHITSSSAALWGSSGVDLSGDPNAPVTDDIDGGPRSRPDIGADEFGTCCALSTAETPGSTVTVTGAGEFELVFRQAAGASLDSFFDLAEDPTRSYDLAGHPASEFRGLFHSSIVSGGLLYVTGQNSYGPQLDLLEATPTRVRTRAATFYQRRPSSGSSAILPGIKAIVDYSVYPSGRLGVHWNRRITTNVPYTDHPLELAVHYEAPADPRSSLVGYSQSGATFPAPASDAFALARFDAAGARTDFLAVMSQPWPAADSLDFTGSPSPYFFSWRDVTPTTLTAAANPSDRWNFMAYFKPTNLADNADGAVASRSADYLTPSSITLLKGQRWLDGTQNTGGSDDYNEAEAAYVLGMDPSPGQGLQFRIDGTVANPRYSPFFKIRKWRSFVESPTVTLDGTPLVKNASYRANLKPLARAHWASTLSWHCTMESTSACDSANLDLGAGVGVSTTGTSAVAGRYGNGLLITANTDKVVASSSDFSPSIGAIEFWYQPRYDSSDGLRYLLWYAQGGAGTFNCFAFEKTTGNALLFWVRINATDNLCTTGGFSTYSTSLSVAAGTAFAWRPYDWVHLKASWNSAGGTRKLRIAVNGVEAAISGTFVAPGGSSTPSLGGCNLNCPVNSPGNPNGILDEVHLYGGLELGGYDTNTPIAHAGLTSDAEEYLADTSKNRSLGLTPVGASRQGSYFYFGADSPFLGLNVGLQTPGAWSTTPGDLVWEYWDGVKWRSLESGFNFTDATNQLTQTGTLYWDDPVTWTPYSVNGGPDLYYVRVHLAAGALSYSTQPVERLIETDILLFQYCGDITAAGREFNFAVPAPTAVKLSSFTATGGDGSALVEWRTASELDNLGFWLYRGLSQDGPWTRLNASLIPGLGSSALGQAYSYRDTGLQNGTRYYYRLEDVDTRAKLTSHGPVSAMPEAGAAADDGGPAGSDGRRGAGTGSCPDWVVTAYGSLVGSGASSTALVCTKHGDPEAVSLQELSRDSRSVTLELWTGGFYALHEPSGRVRVFVPGFDFAQDPQTAALPFRRALVDAVVGRRAQLAGTRALDQVGFRGLVPAALGAAEMQVSWDGTVRAGRRPGRAARGARASELARLLPSVFQGETKSAVVELAPLRFDARRQQLVLAKRLRVRLLFTARKAGESGRGGLGRRQRPERPLAGQVLARLYTTSRGLHAVSFDQLLAGRSRGVAASELRLERQGEAVAFHVEPAGDRFGPGSRLFFFAEREASSTDFTGEVAYELLRAGDGVRMPLATAAPAGSAPRTSAIGFASFEANRFYQPGLLDAADVWLWQAVSSGTTRVTSFSLDAVAAASSQSAELDVYLQGASASGAAVDHHVSVSVNGVLAGEAQFAGKRPYRMSLSVPAALLRDGVNELALTSVADTGVASLVFLDRFTLAHPRASSLVGGRFEGVWTEAGSVDLSTGSGAGPFRIVDVTGTSAPAGTSVGAAWLTDLETSAAAVRFRAEAGHRYWVAGESALSSPRVALPRPSGLKSATNQADYLLIAPRAFLAAAEPLVARRRDQGLEARAVAFEEIADEFGRGQPSAQAIRSFLAHAYQSWSRPSPRYVVLLGDATYDPRNFSGVSQQSPLPALFTRTSYLWTASDSLLAAVNGEDELPDLAIGRLPATSVEQAAALVDKLIAWEGSGQGLGGSAALVADNPDLAGDFEANVRDVAQGFLPGRSELLLLRELGAGTRPAIQAALDGGLSYLDYVGHGGAAVWASENLWNSWDAASLQPQSRQPLLLTLNCLNGYFVAPSYDSLAESLVKAEGRGAIAAFSPSGLSLDGPAHQYHRALMAELTSGRHERLGDAVTAAQKTYAQGGLMPELLSIYHLLGDPAMSILGGAASRPPDPPHTPAE